MARSMTSPETTAALHVLRRFVAEANRRPPHLALDSLLTIAEWMEIEQGGRLTEFQARIDASQPKQFPALMWPSRGSRSTSRPP
jgi:hypothetical protein